MLSKNTNFLRNANNTAFFRDENGKITKDTYFKVRELFYSVSYHNVNYWLHPLLRDSGIPVTPDLAKVMIFSEENIFNKIDIISARTEKVYETIIYNMLLKCKYIHKHEADILIANLNLSYKELYDEYINFIFSHSVEDLEKEGDLPF